MKLITPCCGRSSRYPNLPPKWMLSNHDGQPMLKLALAGIAASPEDIIVTVLKEHEEKFKVTAGLHAAFGYPVKVLVLDQPTKSQAETVAKTVELLNLNEPFLVKDSDNQFTAPEPEQPYNYVCVESLNHFDSINPRNKSYLQTDHNGVVTNIREKVVISDLFNVGGYYFMNPEQFLDFYHRLEGNRLEWNRELYLSDVIGAMILAGIPFRAVNVTGYQDWGTVTEWRRSLLERKAFFVSLDGFVFERGSNYFSPKFAEVKPFPDSVSLLKKMKELGHTLIYVSIRPRELAPVTEAQISDAGLPEGDILYNAPIAHWVLLTAPDPSLPFQSGRSLELRPDDPNLHEKVLGGWGFDLH